MNHRKLKTKKLFLIEKIALIPFIAIILFVGVAMISSCGTNHKTPGLEYMPDMYRSPDYETYSLSPLFADSTSARHPVIGSIPRNYIFFNYPNTPDAYEAAGKEVFNPLPKTEMNIMEGKRLFEIFCIHCHGEKGNGEGTLRAKGDKFPVPSYYDDAHKNLTEGKMFFTITYGKNLMGSHASQISPEERWKIIMYIQKLQMDGLALMQPITSYKDSSSTAMKK